MDQDQNQKKSSLDRANDFVNKARGVYKKGQQLKKFTQAIRITRTLAAASQGLGLGSVIAIILTSLFLATFLLSFLGGGAVSGTENQDEPEPTDSNICSLIDIPGLTCSLDAPGSVGNGESIQYDGHINYKQGEGGGELSSYRVTLKIPSDLIEFTTPLPGSPTTTTSGSQTTYTWLLSDPANATLFQQVSGSNPPEYNFDFSLTARPKTGIEDTIVTVELLVE